jgi:hypothetical protein
VLDSLVAFASQSAGVRITLPFINATDGDEWGAPCTLETCFSVETGTDIIALSLHPHTPPALQQAIAALGISGDRMAATLECFTNRDAEVALVGPIHNDTWRFLEERAACRIRLFADGNEHQAGIVPDLFRRAGQETVLDWMAQVGDAIFLDSRQFFAGRDLPGALDYYYSDIGNVAHIENPELRELTEMALACEKPIILGGPSIVNGVQYVIVDAAWQFSENSDRGYQIAW